MTGAILKFVSFLVFGVLDVICEPSQTCRTAEEKQLCYDVCEDMGEIRSEIDICKAGCERCDCRRGGQDDVYEDVGPNIILCNPTLPHFPMEEMPFVIPPNEKLRN